MRPEKFELLRRITDAKAERREILGGDFRGSKDHARQRMEFLRHELAVSNSLLKKFYPEESHDEKRRN